MSEVPLLEDYRFYVLLIFALVTFFWSLSNIKNGPITSSLFLISSVTIFTWFSFVFGFIATFGVLSGLLLSLGVFAEYFNSKSS